MDIDHVLDNEIINSSTTILSQSLQEGHWIQFERLIEKKIHSLDEFSEFITDLLIHLFKEKTLKENIAWKLNQKLSEFIPKVKKEKIELCRALVLQLGNIQSIRWRAPLTELGFLLIDPYENSPEGATFELPYFIQMMGLIYAMGLLFKHEGLLLDAMQMALASLHILNRKGDLPIGIGCPPDSINEQALRSLYSHILFSIYQVMNDKRLEEIIRHLKQYLVFDRREMDPLTLCLIEIIDHERELPHLPPTTIYQEHDIGFVNLSDFNMSLIIDCFGRRTPLAYIEFKDFEFRALGFQYGALGDMRTFGTFRMEDKEAEGGQIIEREGFTKYSNWTRLIEPSSTMEKPIPGRVFVDFTAIKSEDELEIKSRIVDYDMCDKMHFTLYVKGDQVTINKGHILNKRSLKNYLGPSGHILISNGNSRIELISNCLHEMQVIPLEGEHFFWGADFLIAYEIGDIDKAYTWKIRDYR
ncbi:MAG: hypothetical protein K9M07_03635 [Simkaniaceae bacterium]|nr:hypothetical protein [Simkaniaceae bacterium]